MNKERLLELADIVEKQVHVSNYIGSPSGFNMCTIFHECGTPSCIAGFAIAMRQCAEQHIDKTDVENQYIRSHGYDYAAQYLDISHNIYELFEPDYYPWNSITPAHAAHTIRHLANTGEVNWHHYKKTETKE